LLDGVTEVEPPSNLKWTDLFATELKATEDTATWSSFVNRPFGDPSRFDVDDLLAMVRARADETGDHLWLLQTEPSYLERHIRKLSQAHVIGLSNNKEASASMIDAEIAHDAKVHWFWRDAVGEFERLRSAYTTHRSYIRPGAPLPHQVERTLGSIELMIVNIIHERSKHLEAIITQRPGFRHMYDFKGVHPVERPTPGWDVNMTLKRKFTDFPGKLLPMVTFCHERLFFILTQLLGPPNEEERFRYAMLLDLLNEHLTTSSATGRAQLDEILYDIVSDLATFIELFWTVRTHMLLYASRLIDNCVRTEHSQIWRMAKRRHK